jgi:DNA-directed RNA polymerase specialized sigma54-like protein
MSSLSTEWKPLIHSLKEREKKILSNDKKVISSQKTFLYPGPQIRVVS